MQLAIARSGGVALMAETANIAKVAEKISKEMFAEFFWTKRGPTNFNWDCLNKEVHRKDTHPSDVVFWYDEPYSHYRTYIQTDLKSYAAQSLTTTAVRDAIQSLAKQVSCAEISDQWRNQYVAEGVTPQICGMLFIYNHDGGFDREFSKILQNIDVEKVDIPKGTKIVVLGPEDINWLDNVRYELRQLYGSQDEDALPGRHNCRFFYPDLVRKANVQFEKARAATLEMLTSPWIILEYTRPKPDGRKGLLIFYRKDGSTVEEFVYLIAYLRNYQVFQNFSSIYLKTYRPAPNSHANFEKAIDRYIEEMSGNPDDALSSSIKDIKYSTIPQVISEFSDVLLGMDDD